MASLTINKSDVMLSKRTLKFSDLFYQRYFLYFVFSIFKIYKTFIIPNRIVIFFKVFTRNKTFAFNNVIKNLSYIAFKSNLKKICIPIKRKYKVV